MLASCCRCAASSEREALSFVDCAVSGAWPRSGRGREGLYRALPKGLIAPGESPAETAAREVTEETGVEGRLVEKLGDVRYVYTWQGERVFKIVSFYLFRYAGGRLGDIPAEHAHEVDATRWLPLAAAPGLLAYRGEREMAERALRLLAEEAV